MSNYSLRWYQKECIEKVINYMLTENKNPVAALPTGVGKSVIIAYIIKTILMKYPTTKVLMLTHRKELISQNAEKLKSVWENCPLGIFNAGLKKYDVGYPITYGSIQSINALFNRQELHKLGKIHIILIDECHLVDTQNETSYKKIIESLRLVNQNLKVIGLTATPFRLKQGMISHNGIFDDITYNLCTMDGYKRLISDGYLAPLRAYRTAIQLDVKNVKLKMGEFDSKEIQEIIEKNKFTFLALSESEKIAKETNRKKWLVFCSGISHAEHCCDILNEMGIPSACVHSKKDSKENEQILEHYKQGYITAVCNADKLTTGFDDPDIDLIVMLRPTTSVSLHIQMNGRGTRPADGKTDCLVLDFVGNTMRLGAINNPNLPTKKGKTTGDAPVKICPSCNSYNHAKVRECDFCGYEFPIANKITSLVTNDAVMILDNKLLPIAKPLRTSVFSYNVDKVIYCRHSTMKTNDLVKVIYCHSNGKTTNKVIGFKPYLKSETENFLLLHGVKLENFPKNNDELLRMKDEFPIPKKITVEFGKFPKIIDYLF